MGNALETSMFDGEAFGEPSRDNSQARRPSCPGIEAGRPPSHAPASFALLDDRPTPQAIGPLAPTNLRHPRSGFHSWREGYLIRVSDPQYQAESVDQAAIGPREEQHEPEISEPSDKDVEGSTADSQERDERA